MVTMLSNNPSKQKSALIVELVGLAGVGKTTLSRALSQRNEKIWVAADLELRKREHFPIFASHLLFWLPLLLRRSRSSRGFTWDEIKAMAYLKAWPHVLREQAQQGGIAVLLDHGPVFKLATLHAFGPERLQSRGFAPWWHRTFEQWAFTLDVVIWLNAPDKVLVQRIDARQQQHTVKGKSEREAYDFFLRYGSSYEYILRKLATYGGAAYGGPTLLQFDTNQASIAQIVDEVLVACNLQRD